MFGGNAAPPTQLPAPLVNSVDDSPPAPATALPVHPVVAATEPTAKPAAAPMVQTDWPTLYGPRLDGTVQPDGLNFGWIGSTDVPMVWQRQLGEGYSAPVIQSGYLILFHRLQNEEIVEAVEATTGQTRWQHRYPTSYRDRYGYNGGPRATPICTANAVYTLGAEGVFHRLDLQTGAVVWVRRINQEYAVPQNFFGCGATPLLWQDRLILNAGGICQDAGIIAIDCQSGQTLWKATDHGDSYAMPRATNLHGQDYVLTFTQAGLVSIRPLTGQVIWQIPFRSRLYESVNATTPIICGDIVLVSASYNTGSLALRIQPNGQYKELWRDRKVLESHFSNLLIDPDQRTVYGYSGRHEAGCDLRAVDLATGKLLWQQDLQIGRGSMLQIGKRTLLWGERGQLLLAELSPQGIRILQTHPEPLLTYPTWTPPAIAQQHLYLRNEEKILCIALAAPTNEASN